CFYNHIDSVARWELSWLLGLLTSFTAAAEVLDISEHVGPVDCAAHMLIGRPGGGVNKKQVSTLDEGIAERLVVLGVCCFWDVEARRIHRGIWNVIDKFVTE